MSDTKQLLYKLLQAVYDTPPCRETHHLAVLAAEIKGQMQACNCQQTFPQPNYKETIK
jgi:hypothetical protein